MLEIYDYLLQHDAHLDSANVLAIGPIMGEREVIHKAGST